MPRKKAAAKPQPKILKRDENGLLEGVEYKFDKNGFIDWRAMIGREYLYPNPDLDFPEDVDIDTLPDKDLRSTLAGMEILAHIRGFNAVRYKMTNCGSDSIGIICEIDWIGNYETEGRPITYSSASSAHLFNTTGLMTDYLVENAENRAFAKAIRKFLRINIVTREELFNKKKARKRPGSSQDNEEVESVNESVRKRTKVRRKKGGYEEPHHTALETALTEKGISFAKFKKNVIKNNFQFKDETDPEDWESITDIPAQACIDLIGKLKK